MTQQATNKARKQRYASWLVVLLLSGSLAALPAPAQDLTWHPFEEALALADTSDRLVLVDVWAPWCGWCHKMKREVYPALGSQVDERFVLTRINRDDGETTHRYQGQTLTSTRLAQQLKATGVPTVVVLTPSGDYLLHVSGFLDGDQLRPVLEYVATGAYRRQSFAAFQAQNTP